jgi:L-fuconolactonase
VVDSHVHFWDPALLEYPWLDEHPTLKRTFLPSDYAPLRSRRADAVVFVQADCRPDQSADEVEFVERLAEAEPRVVGIVAYVDLNDESAVVPALDRLQRSQRVVGVRHNIQGRVPGYCLTPAFVRGVQQVGDRGLPFDLCITASQLSEATELVARCPGMSFVLDHCGKPAIRNDAYDAWADALSRLASYGRVSCKLSGLLTEARLEQRTASGLERYASHALATFGAGRCLYGSDWPVCTLGGSADEWRRMTEAFVAHLGAAEQRRFYAGNAIAIYGLKLHANSIS